MLGERRRWKETSGKWTPENTFWVATVKIGSSDGGAWELHVV